MTDLVKSDRARRLTAEEIAQFRERGYVKNLPLFDEAGVRDLQSRFEALLDAVPEGVDLYRVNNWHKANRWIYQLSQLPAILDYVEDILGPNFNQWGGGFFIKYPHDGTKVPFHQDASYWPLDPRVNLTVWLAVFDTDAGNGCMRIVPGSHKWGDLRHEDLPDAPHWSSMSREEQAKSKYVLWKQVNPDAFSEEQMVDMDLLAGEISLHDDDLIHGSNANNSDRMRAGIAFRYIPAEVKCDLNVWPNFEVYGCRGVDEYQHNPIGKIPTGYSYPKSFNEHSSEFE